MTTPADNPSGRPCYSHHDHDDEFEDESGSQHGEKTGVDPLTARALKHAERSLQKSNSVEAMIGALSAQQVQLANHLFGAVSETLANSPRDLGTLERIGKSVTVLQLVHRQIDRYAQTQLQLREARRKSRLGPIGKPAPRGFPLRQPTGR